MIAVLGRVASAAVVTVTAGLTLAGCHFAKPPPGSTAGGPDNVVASTPADPAAARLSDAPALLVQCAVNTAGVKPTGQDWFRNGHVVITSSDATNFDTWWRAHFTPGPYPQTFVIDGHPTHYLAFGATWVQKGGQWVPTHTALSDPQAQRTSLYAWSVWAAAHDKLPPAVCGPSQSAHAMQEQVFAKAPDAGNPWDT